MGTQANRLLTQAGDGLAMVNVVLETHAVAPVYRFEMTLPLSK